jgi:hypothetical protein
MIRETLRHKREADIRHSQRVSETPLAPRNSDAGPCPLEVRAGIHVDRISEFSIKGTGWTVDFYIWFLWQGKELNPDESFQLLEGEIESREKKTTHAARI